MTGQDDYSQEMESGMHPLWSDQDLENLLAGFASVDADLDEPLGRLRTLALNEPIPEPRADVLALLEGTVTGACLRRRIVVAAVVTMGVSTLTVAGAAAASETVREPLDTFVHKVVDGLSLSGAVGSPTPAKPPATEYHITPPDRSPELSQPRLGSAPTGTGAAGDSQGSEADQGVGASSERHAGVQSSRTPRHQPHSPARGSSDDEGESGSTKHAGQGQGQGAGQGQGHGHGHAYGHSKDHKTDGHGQGHAYGHDDDHAQGKGHDKDKHKDKDHKDKDKDG